jgi:carboxylesterase
MNNILQGGEPFYFPGNDIGCLLVHGFTATPQEVRWLGEFLAHEGYTVLGIRLAGHATDVADLARSRWHDWLASVEDGYYLISGRCKEIVVLGLSLGGALALLLSNQFPVAGVVAMSTPHRLPPDPRLRLLRPALKPLSAIYRYSKKGPSDWNALDAKEARVQYDYRPLRSVIELDLVLAEMRKILPQLSIPVLLMHSKSDHFVPPEHVILNFDLIGSAEKEMIWVEKSNHIITCDCDRDQVFSVAADFIKRISRSSA